MFSARPHEEHLCRWGLAPVQGLLKDNALTYKLGFQQKGKGPLLLPIATNPKNALRVPSGVQDN